MMSASRLQEVVHGMSIPAKNQASTPAGAKVNAPTEVERLADFKQRAVEALSMWLRWNRAYGQVTAFMYREGGDQQDLEDLMDQMDQLRDRAVKLSRELVDR